MRLLWLKRWLGKLGFGPKKSMNLYCNNKAAVVIAHNIVQYDRTKHVKIDRHFSKEKPNNEIIFFPFVNSEYKLADVFTKPVSTILFSTRFISWACVIYLLQLKREF